MKPALSFQEGPKPYTWQQFPHGDYLRAEIERKLTPWLPRMFGYHMLKLGNLVESWQPVKVLLSTKFGRKQGFTGVIADVDELPFYEHSVDACILSHCLEYHSDPHHILREAHRTLIPGGYR